MNGDELSGFANALATLIGPGLSADQSITFYVVVGIPIFIYALGMAGPWRVAFSREMRQYFTTANGYAVLVLFIFFVGFLYIEQIFTRWVTESPDVAGRDAPAEFQPLGMIWVCMLAIPIIASRGIAHERETGTLELLLTSPLPPFSFVWAKYLASILMFSLGLLATYPIPLLIEANATENGLDWGSVRASYVGAMLMGSSFLVVGIFINTAIRRYLTALFVTMMVIFLMVIVSLVADSPRANEEDWVRGLSIYHHAWPIIAESTMRWQDLVFHLATATIFLFGSLVMIESRRR